MTRFSDPEMPERFDKEGNLGELVAFVHPRLELEVETSFGKADAAKVEAIVVLSGPNAGSVNRDELMFGNLGVILSGSTGPTVLGRLGQGKAKPGRSAPWILEPASDEDKVLAEKWFDLNTFEDGSGHVTVNADVVGLEDEEDPDF